MGCTVCTLGSRFEAAHGRVLGCMRGGAGVGPLFGGDGTSWGGAELRLLQVMHASWEQSGVAQHLAAHVVM